MCDAYPPIDVLLLFAAWHSPQFVLPAGCGPYDRVPMCDRCEPVTRPVTVFALWWQKLQPLTDTPHVELGAAVPRPSWWQVVVVHRPYGAPYGVPRFPLYDRSAIVRFTDPVR